MSGLKPFSLELNDLACGCARRGVEGALAAMASDVVDVAFGLCDGTQSRGEQKQHLMCDVAAGSSMEREVGAEHGLLKPDTVQTLEVWCAARLLEASSAGVRQVGMKPEGDMESLDLEMEPGFEKERQHGDDKAAQEGEARESLAAIGQSDCEAPSSALARGRHENPGGSFGSCTDGDPAEEKAGATLEGKEERFEKMEESARVGRAGAPGGSQGSSPAWRGAVAADVTGLLPLSSRCGCRIRGGQCLDESFPRSNPERCLECLYADGDTCGCDCHNCRAPAGWHMRARMATPAAGESGPEAMEHRRKRKMDRKKKKKRRKGKGSKRVRRRVELPITWVSLPSG